MKKIIIALLALTLMLTAIVACDDDEATDGTSGVESSVSGSSSVEGITSSELDAWNGVSTDVLPGPATDSDSQGTDSSATSSYDKDQGFLPWVPLD